MTTERIPAGLRAAGKRLWRDINETLALDEHERALLLEAARTADALDALEQIVRRGVGKGEPGSHGGSPAAPDARPADRISAAARRPAAGPAASSAPWSRARHLPRNRPASGELMRRREPSAALQFDEHQLRAFTFLIDELGPDGDRLSKDDPALLRLERWLRETDSNCPAGVIDIAIWRAEAGTRSHLRRWQPTAESSS
jgi:hypothetical protein